MRIGIDVGGTKAVIALINDQHQILSRERIPTSGQSCKEIMEKIAQRIAQLSQVHGAPEFIGMGVPGTVDETAKIVVNAPNLGWYNEPAAQYLSDACGAQVLLAQDTRAAAWAEASAPEMQQRRCIACITLGTGIGCGIVLDGRIWHGALGTAGEIGHTPVVPGGRVCGCGRQGCMEAYASGTGIARTARERGICETSEEVFALAQAGDERALALIEEAVGHAAAAITTLINLFSPDAVLFSGGLSAQKELYVEPLMKKIREMAYQDALGEKLYMGYAAFGADAPVIGAAFLDEAFK